MCSRALKHKRVQESELNVAVGLSHWLPRDETYPEIVQGTTEVHHELQDPSFPQTDAVWGQGAHLNSSKA